MEEWSIFAKPKYPVTWDFTLYGLLGYGNVQLDKTINFGMKMNKGGFQWGLGLSYMFNEYFDFFADYKFLANEFDGFGYNHRPTEVSVDSLTVGVIYKFLTTKEVNPILFALIQAFVYRTTYSPMQKMLIG